MHTVYSTPEAYGLTFLGEIEWSDGDDGFDLTGVWIDASGQLYYADDFGCSCPAPFENRTLLEDLSRCTLLELQGHLSSRSQHSTVPVGRKVPAVLELLGKAGVVHRERAFISSR
jgi:hypothetical protein